MISSVKKSYVGTFLLCFGLASVSMQSAQYAQSAGEVLKSAGSWASKYPVATTLGVLGTAAAGVVGGAYGWWHYNNPDAITRKFIANPEKHKQQFLSMRAAVLEAAFVKDEHKHILSWFGALRRAESLVQWQGQNEERPFTEKELMDGALGCTRSPTLGRALIDVGANVNAQNFEGTTNLMLAAMIGDYHRAEWLLDMGADSTLKETSGPYKGYTALNFAQPTEHEGKRLVANKERIRDLLTNGFTVKYALNVYERYDDPNILLAMLNEWENRRIILRHKKVQGPLKEMPEEVINRVGEFVGCSPIKSEKAHRQQAKVKSEQDHKHSIAQGEQKGDYARFLVVLEKAKQKGHTKLIIALEKELGVEPSKKVEEPSAKSFWTSLCSGKGLAFVGLATASYVAYRLIKR